MKKHIWKIIFGVAALLLIGSFYWASVAGEKSNEGVVISEHIKGNSDASVTLVEYSDFQCPACGQFYPVVKEIVEEYEDSLKFEYKHFPLISVHAFAVPAAKAAEAAAQQGKFFEMHDKLFENQSAWSNAASPQPFFVQYANEIGLDVDQFKRQMRASDIDKAIENSFNEARSLGLTGTPSFFLNGERLEFETFQEFRDAIDNAVSGNTVPIENSTSEVDVQFGI